MKLIDLWLAEYSASQDAFHVAPAAQTVARNQVQAIRRQPNDWVVVKVGDQAEVEEAVAILTEMRIGMARLKGSLVSES